MSEIWPVYSGKSFNLWQPDTGVYYDSVDAANITEHLQQKRLSQNRTSSSAFAEQLKKTGFCVEPCWKKSGGIPGKHLSLIVFPHRLS